VKSLTITLTLFLVRKKRKKRRSKMESPIEMKIIRIEGEDFFVLSVMVDGVSTLYEMGSAVELMAFHRVLAEVSLSIVNVAKQKEVKIKKGLH
tara:strand:- start:729 stop:1007 length:279 start_codon:yes stop_codon:yes gene_type:complete